MLGIYISKAISVNFSKGAKYPNKPLLDNIDKQYENNQFDSDLFMAQLKSWADKHNQNIKNKKMKVGDKIDE